MAQKELSNLPPGSVLDGKYKVDKQVGAGGMGAVFMATHTTIGRRVAIKTLHAEFTADEQVVARFHREAQLAGSIGHDNICEVTDIGTLDNGSPYLVMPLLQGLPLADVLEDGKTLTLDRVVDIGGQTLSALEAAHNASIVHRDLKPDNIFITRMGDREDFVKLLDFGISKIMEQDEVTALTMTGTVLGTPFYMSPEQAKGSKHLDHRVDIYAMGVILYEALTGTRPYTGDTYNEIMFKIIAEPFALPSTLNPSVPLQVEQVISKAMAKEQEDRFSSAGEMKLALEAAAKGQATNFDTRMSNAPTMAQSGPYTPAPGIDYTPGSIAVAGVTTPPSSHGEGRESEGKSKKTALIVGLSLVALLVMVAVVVLVLFGDDAEKTQSPAPGLAVPPATLEIPSKPEAPPKPEPPEPQLSAESAVQAVEQEPPITEAPSEVAEKHTSKKKKKKKNSAETSPGKAVPTSGKKDKKTVEGRFGTTFVGDYED